MADFPIPENPDFNTSLRALETTDRAHADLLNGLFRRLVTNDAYLGKKADSAVQTIQVGGVVQAAADGVVNLPVYYAESYRIMVSGDTPTNAYAHMFTIRGIGNYADSVLQLDITTREHDNVCHLFVNAVSGNSKLITGNLQYNGSDFGQLVTAYRYVKGDTAEIQVWCVLRPYEEIRLYIKTLNGRAVKVEWINAVHESLPADASEVYTPVHTMINAADIKAGILPVERGGTGSGDAASARAALGITPAGIGAVGSTGTTAAGQVAAFADTAGNIKSSGFTMEASVPAGAKFTDTVYTHPSTEGNKHIPAGGTVGQVLKNSASGTAVWADSGGGFLAAAAAPANKEMLWVNTTNNTLNYWNGSAWTAIAGVWG